MVAVAGAVLPGGTVAGSAMVVSVNASPKTCVGQDRAENITIGNIAPGLGASQSGHTAAMRTGTNAEQNAADRESCQAATP